MKCKIKECPSYSRFKSNSESDGLCDLGMEYLKECPLHNHILSLEAELHDHKKMIECLKVINTELAKQKDKAKARKKALHVCTTCKHRTEVFNGELICLNKKAGSYKTVVVFKESCDSWENGIKE